MLIAFAPWEFKALGVVFLVGAAYIFLHFFFPERLRLPEPRPATRPATQPPINIQSLLFPSARGQINNLVNEGERLRRNLPAQANRSDLAASLAGAMMSHQYLWDIARWQERAWSAVQRLAPTSTALFNNVDIPALSYDSMRQHLARTSD